MKGPEAVSEENFFLNRPIKNKNCLWWPCLLMDQDQMWNLYRGPSIDPSYQVSVHLANMAATGNSCFWLVDLIKSSPLKPLDQMNRNLVGSIYERSCIKIAHFVWPCLLTDQDEMYNLYRGPSINASYQVSVHLAKWFQKRRFFRNQPIRNKNYHR
jgi:hypothetical protein